MAAISTHGFGPFTFSVSPGECLGLTGPSGTGKSLLLRALVDLDPHEGTVRLDGVDAVDTPAHTWRQKVGYLPASPRWWFPTVGEHFESDPGILGLLGFEPEVIGWSVSRLSSGEAQRLALARLIAQKPEVLLLDEPTAHLDETNSEHVEQLVGTLRRERGIPVVWVSHDRSQLRSVSTRVLALEDGRWVECHR